MVRRARSARAGGALASQRRRRDGDERDRTGPAPRRRRRRERRPPRKSPAASGELARSFGGRAARSRGRSTWASASRRDWRRSAQPGDAVADVEGGVHVGGRCLRRVAREEENDPEVLRQVERLELASVAGAELRAVHEEERDSRRRCERPGGAALRPEAARAASRWRGGARWQHPSCRRRDRRRPGSASRSAPASTARRRRSGRARGAPHVTSVSPGKPSTRSSGASPSSIRSTRSIRCRTVRTSCFAVVARRPDDEREVDLRRRGRAGHRNAFVRATNS